MMLNEPRWKKVLGRWVPLQKTAEVKLIVACLAHWLSEEPIDAALHGREPYASHGFEPGGPVWLYARAVGIDPSFLRVQIERSQAFVDPRPRRRGASLAANEERADMAIELDSG